MQAKHKRKHGRVIPFERDVEFFLRRGSQRLERNNLIEAISNYYLAQQCEPQNPEIKLAIAEVLTEMHRYEQSNRILFPMLTMDNAPAECFFGIACNFLGLQEFAYAQDSLESYLSIEPEGEFVPDALDMLDVIEDETALYSMPGVYGKEENAAFKICMEGRQLIENGRPEDAVELLKKASTIYYNIDFVHNNLALAYFCAKQSQRAMEVIGGVLQKDPENVQAHCNLLLFMHAAQNKEGVKRALTFLREADTQDPQDWNRMAVVFMELGNMQEALVILKKLQNVLPYEEGTLHRLGVCHYALGQYKKAYECYERLSKADPRDTVAAYYKLICMRADKGKPDKIDWLHHYQVPYTEMLRRVREINEISARPKQEIERMWRNDPDFCALLAWSLHLQDEGTKRTVLQLVATFADYEAELMLRTFLLDRLQPDAVKQDVFGMLKQIGAREPYIAYLRGALVQSRVQMHRAGGKGERVPIAYQRMLELCVSHMRDHAHGDVILKAVEIFQSYVDHQDELPKLRRPQVIAFAAALEYLARKSMNLRVNKAVIAEQYDISSLRMTNAVNKLQSVLNEEEK